VNTLINRTAEVIDLGLIDYPKAWDFQTNLFNETLAVKSANRNRAEPDQAPTNNYFIFCEHPHVFTLGKSGDEKNLLIKREALESIHASFFPINRGGDITYHGPGQLVVYPVMDLENFFTDIHRYMRSLEEAVILTLSEFGIVAGRISGLTGVWLEPTQPQRARKICAFGVKTSRWVTLHGLALNVNTDLSYFDYIIPCGIEGKAVTSMQKELSGPQDISIVKKKLEGHLVSLFDASLQVVTHKK
jgi:lipoyl(octanoyl) transferase